MTAGESVCADRLVEDADLRSAQELFGDENVSLDTFTPKSAKEFEQFGRLVAQKYLFPHTKSAHYKALLKVLLKDALVALDVQQVKDIETSVAGIRSDKLKEDKAKHATVKGADSGHCSHVHLGVFMLFCSIGDSMLRSQLLTFE